jgi:type IV secretory pathway protease TraF
MSLMRGDVTILRAVQCTLLGSVVLFAAAGQFLRAGAKAVDPSLNYAVTTASVAIIGVIFVVRRTLVLRSAESLVSRPDDSLSLNHWRSGYLTTYALCETLALFGLILRIMGCRPNQSWPFYIGAFALLLFFRPREPRSA